MQGGPYGQLAQAMTPPGLSAAQVQSGLGPAIGGGMSDYLSPAFSQFGGSPVMPMTQAMGGAYPIGGMSPYARDPNQMIASRRFGYIPSVMEAPMYGAPMVGPPVIGPPVIGSPYYSPRLPYGNPYYDSYSPLVPIY